MPAKALNMTAQERANWHPDWAKVKLRRGHKLKGWRRIKDDVKWLDQAGQEVSSVPQYYAIWTWTAQSGGGGYWVYSGNCTSRPPEPAVPEDDMPEGLQIIEECS